MNAAVFTASTWLTWIHVKRKKYQTSTEDKTTIYFVVQIIFDTFSAQVLTTFFETLSCTYRHGTAFLNAAPKVACWSAEHFSLFVPSVLLLPPYYFMSIAGRSYIQNSQSVVLIDRYYFAFKAQMKALVAFFVTNFGKHDPKVLLPVLFLVNMIILVFDFWYIHYNIEILNIVEIVGMLMASWSVVMAITANFGGMASTGPISLLLCGYVLLLLWGANLIVQRGRSDLSPAAAPSPGKASQTSTSGSGASNNVTSGDGDDESPCGGGEQEVHIEFDDPSYHTVVKRCERWPTHSSVVVTVRDTDDIPVEGITWRHLHRHPFCRLRLVIQNVRTLEGLSEVTPASRQLAPPSRIAHVVGAIQGRLEKLSLWGEDRLARLLPTYFTSHVDCHLAECNYEIEIVSSMTQRADSKKLIKWLDKVSPLNLTSLDLADNRLSQKDVRRLASYLTSSLHGSLATITLTGENNLHGLRDHTPPILGRLFCATHAHLLPKSLRPLFSYEDPTEDLLQEGHGRWGDSSSLHALADSLMFNTAVLEVTITEGVPLPLLALRNNTLTELDLSGRKLGVADAAILGAGLTYNTSLHTLRLDGSGIAVSEEGCGNDCTGGVEFLSHGLIHQDTLTCLSLRENGIGPWSAAVLAEALGSSLALTSVDLMGNPLEREGATMLLAVAKEHSTLQTLCGLIAGMVALDLSECRLQPSDALLLAADLRTSAFATSLTSLDLSGNAIGDEGAQALAAVFFPDEQNKFNATLRTLHLAGNGVGSEGLMALATACCPRVPGARSMPLSTLGLSRNNLSYNGHTVDPEGIAMLSTALLQDGCCLTRLDLGENCICAPGAEDLVQLVAQSPSLRELNLLGCSLQQPGAEAIALAFEKNPTLYTVCGLAPGVGPMERLDLSHRHLAPGDAVLLAGDIRKRTATATWTLTTLVLDQNQLAGPAMGPEVVFGLAALGVALRRCSGLTALSLRANEVGPMGAAALAATVALSESLTSLDMWGNDVKSEGWRSLRGALAMRKTRLALCGAMLDDDELDLCEKALLPEEAEFLTNDLRSNATLRSLQ
eukprot:gene7754-9218_t